EPRELAGGINRAEVFGNGRRKDLALLDGEKTVGEIGIEGEWRETSNGCRSDGFPRSDPGAGICTDERREEDDGFKQRTRNPVIAEPFENRDEVNRRPAKAALIFAKAQAHEAGFGELVPQLGT